MSAPALHPVGLRHYGMGEAGRSTVTRDAKETP